MSQATLPPQFESEIAAAVAGMLPDQAQPDCGKANLLDAVWGTVTLEPHEVALLDTPLLQRLRRLRQLGSSHLVFPGSHHTRFEHTLGVAHLTGQACAVLSRKHPTYFDPQLIQNLRMAALCHDLGHGPYSHCSEKFIARLDPMPELLGQNADAAERLSGLMVTSAPLVRFFRQLDATYDTNLDPQFMAEAICGNLPRDQAFLGEVLHGPFDTDKLDYLVRDSKFCGIQPSVDIARILESLDICVTDDTPHLIGERDGAAALVQLVHHRQHLFAVVYQHRVSRSFAAMLDIALECAHADGTMIGDKPLTSPADFLTLDDALLMSPGFVAPSRAANLLQDMRDRQLFKVAGSVEGNQLSAGQRQRLASDARALAQEIAATAKVPEHLVTINVCPRQDNSEAMNMLIRQSSEPVTLGALMDMRDDTIPLHSFLERHLVLCPEKHCPVVSQVAAQVLSQVVPASAYVSRTTP